MDKPTLPSLPFPSLYYIFKATKAKLSQPKISIMMKLLSSRSSPINHNHIINVYKFKTTHYSNPHNPFFYPSFNSNNGRKIAVYCKLETSKKGRKGKLRVPIKTEIAAPEPEAAPAVSEKGGGGGGVAPPKGKKDGSWLMKGFSRKVLAALSNLPLALAEMFALAALMAMGTVIDQGEAPDFYFQKYPEDNPVLGFFTWRWILTLGFDHMFSSPIFLGILIILGASLMACTYTTQIPIAKVEFCAFS